MAHIPDHPALPNVLQERERKRANREVREVNVQKRRDCIEQGGTWTVVDQETLAGSCELPPEEEPTPEPPRVLGRPDELRREVRPGEVPQGNEVFVRDEAGVLRVQTPETKAEDIRTSEIQTAQQEAEQTGRLSATQALEANKETQRKISLAAGAGQIDFNTIMTAEELGINWKEAFLAGSSNIIPGAIAVGGTAAAAGLIAGPAAPVTVPVAAVIGAGFGAIGNFYRGVTSNIKAQKGDLLSGKTKELKGRKLAMMNYISAANANPAGAEDFLLAYQIEKSLIRRDYNTLNVEAAEASTLFGGQDGTAQIITYDVFFESVEPSLDLRMEEAILKPDPTRAYLSLEDLQ